MRVNKDILIAKIGSNITPMKIKGIPIIIPRDNPLTVSKICL